MKRDTMGLGLSGLLQIQPAAADDYRYTAAADYLSRLKRKERRIKRYQYLIVFWSPDDDFPIMACCEVCGQKVRGE